jgi:hypothetical protein
MTLEVLYFDGCPGHERLLPSLRALAEEHGVQLRMRSIASVEDAERQSFLGSPSVRVNGLDVEPGAHERRDFGLKCRLYRAAGRHSVLPRREWIEQALRRGTT